MGTSYFHGIGNGAAKPSTNLNLAARAFGAPAYAGKAAGIGAQKDIGAAISLAKGVLKPGMKTAVTAAPGPKKV